MRMRRQERKLRKGDRGQAAVFLVLALGVFLIGGVGFVVDGANLWFHKQSAQTAADAACTAGAMDLLSNAASATPPSPNWIPVSDDGSNFLCSGKTGSTQNSSFPPCAYASANGYSGSASQDVQVSFHTASVAVDCPTAFPFSVTACKADEIAATPYMRIDVRDRVPTTFMRLVGAGPSATVPARSICGISNVLSPVPILVLNPNAPNNAGSTFQGSNFTLTVTGAPKSIQVNSTDGNAVNLSGTITLSNSAGDEDGRFLVAGRELESNAGVPSSVKWANAAGVMSDPFATIKAPNPPSLATVTYNTTGCPNSTKPACCPGIPNTVHCDFYQHGYYPSMFCPPSINGVAAICVVPGFPASTGATGFAVFEPGTYYLAEDFYAGAGSCLRSVTGASDGGGSMFYLSDLSVLRVDSDSGNSCPSSVSSISLADAACPGGNLNLPTAVTVTGNVLLAPCTGAYGDPSGGGTVRGMLFFHDRDVQPDQSQWLGSGALVGNVYLHHCHFTPSGGGAANCDPDAFTQTLTLGGSNTYIVGGIVVDQLTINSGANINVVLNPNPQYYVLKASLLQ